METGAFLNPGTVVRMAGIHEGHSVADFGAGAGFFTRAAARAVGEHGVVWAVDINRDLLPRLKNLAIAEGLTTVEVVQGDIESPHGSNLPENHFDFCLVSNVLFSVEHKDACMEEVCRVLKPGSGRGVFVDWKGSFGGLGPHPDHVITAAAAAKLCEAHGLSFAGEIPAGAYHWGFIVRKKTAKQA